MANCCCGNPWPDIAWGGAEWVGGAWDAACGAACGAGAWTPEQAPARQGSCRSYSILIVILLIIQI